MRKVVNEYIRTEVEHKIPLSEYSEGKNKKMIGFTVTYGYPEVLDSVYVLDFGNLISKDFSVFEKYILKNISSGEIKEVYSVDIIALARTSPALRYMFVCICELSDSYNGIIYDDGECPREDLGNILSK